MNIKDFGVEIWMNTHENDCKYNLSETCANPMTTDELLELSGKKDELLDEILNIKLDYGEITGSIRLKTALCSLYDNITPDNITIAHGAIGANSLALMSIVEPQDHVIAFIPTYQQHYSLPESIGADITLLRLREEYGWQPDMDEFKAALRPNTKVICINNPNNPTGSNLSESVLKEIIDTARKHDIYIFCDEAYRGLNHYGDSFGPSVADLYEKGVVTGSMSKTFALAGLRLGWIAGPSEVIADINRHRDYHIISVGKIDDLMSAIAVENCNAVLERNLHICRENIAFLDKWVSAEPHISFVKPSASTTAFLKFDLNMTSEELCLRLKQEAGVLFVPGSAFTFDDHLRIGFGNDSKTIQNGLSAFSDWLKQF